MRSRAHALFATLAISTLVAGALVAQPAMSVDCNSWEAQPKNPGAGDNVLFGIETASPCFTWVVGYSADASGNRQTLIEKWNGFEWKTQSISNSGNVTTGAIAGGVLNDMAATSTSNAWAVGHVGVVGAQPPAALFVRWNGSRWTRYVTPLDDPIWESEILGVAAVSKNNFWAVGRSFDQAEEENRAVIFHWNGSSWKPSKIVLPQSLDGVDVSLNGVGASSSGAWAVGSFAGIGGRRQTLILKWNLHEWKRVDTPNVSMQHNVLQGISVIGTTVWAGGYIQSPQDPNVISQRVLQRNGSQWKATSVNAPAGPVSDVTIIPGGSWTAGFSVCVTTCDPDKVTAQIMKWDSRQKVWRGIQTLTVGANSWFYDIDASSIRNVWAVGAYQEPGGPLRTFILRGGNG